METDSPHGKPIEHPLGLAPPVELQESTDVILLWSGETQLHQESNTKTGKASVFFDALPRPGIRFEFEMESEDNGTFGPEQLRRWFDGSNLKEGEFDAGSILSKLDVRPTNSQGDHLRGIVLDWTAEPSERFSSAKLLVINGPNARGTVIQRGTATFTGRLAGFAQNGMTITVDQLHTEKQPTRSLYGITHVAEFRFDEPQPFDCFEEAATVLFKTLSLMRGRWVGLIGPWLYVSDELRAISPHVTRVSKNGSSHTWCHDMILGVCEELFTCLLTVGKDRSRDDALQTAVFWLIESQLCAGGVEGSVILQQAALEALAWFVIVYDRKLCSPDGFEKLPASDKIRWLLSLYSIPPVIPPHFDELVSYAKEYNLMDLPAVLIDVRNALVHGSPSKVERLFKRQRGDEERTRLWYLVGGLLEQTVLAVAGYRGDILRRDIDTEWSTSAVKPAPWK